MKQCKVELVPVYTLRMQLAQTQDGDKIEAEVFHI